ncbi:MAG: LysR family transcriptional regulator [Acidimicrobiales bacterium]
MTFAQLRTFLAVAEAGSVRGAAERLVVSQPSVSAAVGSLERELGVDLVARQGRGLRLTDAGAAFAATVREALGLLEQGARTAASVEEPGRGTVRVAAVTTAAERFLLPLIAAFRREHPGAGVRVQVGNRTTMWGALSEHAADLVVAGRPPDALGARVLGRAANSLVLVGPGEDSGAPIDQTRQLGEETWLLREEGSGTRDASEELLRRLGIDPPTMILGSNGAVEEAVAAGLGIALISSYAVADRIADGTVRMRDCPGTPLERPWHLLCHGTEPLSPTACLLVASMASAEPGFSLTSEGRRVLAR